MATNDDDSLLFSNPLVFCCMKCHTIVGDSTLIAGTNADLQAITLIGASKIQREEELLTSTTSESIDKGSTYFQLSCSRCQHNLGRYYITTPRILDDLREKFTFFIQSLESYVLGRAEIGESTKEPITLTRTEAVREVAATDVPVDRTMTKGEDPLLPRLAHKTEELEEGLLKAQHVILGLESRIAALEEFIAKMQLPSLDIAASSQSLRASNRTTIQRSQGNALLSTSLTASIDSHGRNYSSPRPVIASASFDANRNGHSQSSPLQKRQRI